MGLTDRQKQRIQDELNKRGVRALCPLCGQSSWTIADSFVMANPVALGGDTVIGGGGVPMAQLICTNCGFVSHHAVGALDFDLS